MQYQPGKRSDEESGPFVKRRNGRKKTWRTKAAWHVPLLGPLSEGKRIYV